MNRKYLIGAGLLIISQAFQSCLKGEDVYQEKEITYTELELSVGGECSLTEKPMSRADDATKEIYGINVAMLIPNTNGTFAQKAYAYGIFDNVKAENLKLNVIDGYKYRISCTMIKEAKDSLLTGNGILYPFTLSKGETPTLGQITNKFVTAEQADGTQRYLYDLESSKIGTSGQSNYTRPFIRRYHGLIDNLSVTANQANTLEVYRRYFGVQFKQNGLQKNCRLEIQLEGAPTVWLTPSQTQSAELMVSMKALTGVVEAGKVMTDNARVKVIVHQTGKTPVDILNYNISFKRNYMHTIAISDIDHFGTGSNVTIHVEETELENSAQEDLPWQGGN